MLIVHLNKVIPPTLFTPHSRIQSLIWLQSCVVSSCWRCSIPDCLGGRWQALGEVSTMPTVRDRLRAARSSLKPSLSEWVELGINATCNAPQTVVAVKLSYNIVSQNNTSFDRTPVAERYWNTVLYVRTNTKYHNYVVYYMKGACSAVVR